MKLLDLLVKELPSQGGWPEGMLSVLQSKIDGELNFYAMQVEQGDTPDTISDFDLYLDNNTQVQGFRGDYIIVTKDQYEAALLKGQV